jgi:hypothetical protein
MVADTALFDVAKPAVRIARAWAMPNADTFSIKPIADLLLERLPGGVIVDPFARNSQIGTIRNDINAETDAHYHMDAIDFCEMLAARGVRADAVLLDPPYSPRQFSECYKAAGIKPTEKHTQNARILATVKASLAALLKSGGVAITCGWNSTGLGMKRGMVLREVLIVCHGAAHNDTIVTVEVKL